MRAASRAWPLALLVAVIAAFLNSVDVPFLLDDEVSITDNETVQRLGWSSLWPRPEVYTAGRPLLNLSFALNHAIGGASPRGYHAVNIAIHALAALALFGLVRRTLLSPPLRAKWAARASAVAGIAALLWAVHPLHTESVTYISQRAESLMGLFYLCTLYAFVRAAETSRPAWAALAVASCLVGMLVKEVMVTAPVIALLYDRAFLSVSFRELWQRRRALHLSLAATWIVLFALMAATRVGERGIGYGFSLAWHEYLRIELSAVLRYLGLAFWPHPLVFDYGREVPIPSAFAVAVLAILIGALLAATVLAWRRRPALGFLGCWFFVILSPTSSFVPVAGQPVAENRMYLPLAALCLLGAIAVSTALARRAAVAAAAVAAGLAWLTIQRNTDYRSELAIWADTVAKRPGSARANHYYATALLRLGRTDEALGYLERAIQIAPGYAQAHVNLGCVYLGRQRLEEAIRHLEFAVRLKPQEPVALSNLGTALFHAGRRAEAVPYYQAALQVRPHNPDFKVNLGIVLAHLGRTAEALALFEETLRLHPGHAGARTNLQQLRAALQPPAGAQR